MYTSLLFAVSSTSVVFLATTDVAVSSFARVRRVGSAISEGLMNFHISLLLADAIILIINKKGSQVSEWTSTTGFDDIVAIFRFLEQVMLFLNSFVFAECGRRRTYRNLVKLMIIQLFFSERMK